jgi:hypothetical protein
VTGGRGGSGDGLGGRGGAGDGGCTMSLRLVRKAIVDFQAVAWLLIVAKEKKWDKDETACILRFIIV